jgi:hypothetical protein
VTSVATSLLDGVPLQNLHTSMFVMAWLTPTLTQKPLAFIFSCILTEISSVLTPGRIKVGVIPQYQVDAVTL